MKMSYFWHKNVIFVNAFARFSFLILSKSSILHFFFKLIFFRLNKLLFSHFYNFFFRLLSANLDFGSRALFNLVLQKLNKVGRLMNAACIVLALR